MKLTYGADPEVFVRRVGSKNEIDPVCGLIGERTNLGDGFEVQEDNVMLEFNVPPSSTVNELVRSVKEGMERSIGYLCERTHEDWELVPGCEFLVPLQQLRHPLARRFGCNPDFDATRYGNMKPRVNPGVLIEEGGAWRFGGGHIHLGYDMELVSRLDMIRLCDFFLKAHIISGARRQRWYGSAGTFRPTPYGVEYRVPSNAWVTGEQTSFVVNGLTKLTRFVSEITSPVTFLEMQKFASEFDQQVA